MTARLIVQFWLNRALGHCVLEDADLETELTEAETNALAYLECTATLPTFDPAEYDTEAEQIEYAQQFGECAMAIDPLGGIAVQLRAGGSRGVTGYEPVITP
jgi:hypothetical protein